MISNNVIGSIIGRTNKIRSLQRLQRLQGFSRFSRLSRHVEQKVCGCNSVDLGNTFKNHYFIYYIHLCVFHAQTFWCLSLLSLLTLLESQSSIMTEDL